MPSKALYMMSLVYTLFTGARALFRLSLLVPRYRFCFGGKDIVEPLVQIGSHLHNETD
jgi:hypothetical protein